MTTTEATTTTTTETMPAKKPRKPRADKGAARSVKPATALDHLLKGLPQAEALKSALAVASVEEIKTHAAERAQRA